MLPLPNHQEPAVSSHSIRISRLPARNRTTHRAFPASVHTRLCSNRVFASAYQIFASALLLGGLVVQLDHHAIGVADENLPCRSARHLAGIERHPPGLKPLLHAIETTAGEGNVVDHAGIGLLLLTSRRNIHEVHHRAAFAVHPPPRKSELGPVAIFQAEHILVEPHGLVEPAGSDIEMVEHAHAHAMSLPML